jgi:arsenate reductase
MKATIYHNPRCGTSRRTLEILEEAGAEIEVVDYLKQPPSVAELRRLYARAGITRAADCAPGKAWPRTSTC